MSIPTVSCRLDCRLPRRRFLQATAFLPLLAGASTARAADARSTFRDAQIETLQTGSSAKLNALDSIDRTLRQARDWTIRAATQIILSPQPLIISRDSAGMLSDLIVAGSERFLKDAGRPDGEKTSIQNLHRFVGQMMDFGRGAGGRMGEGSFGHAQGKLCPIWPFC